MTITFDLTRCILIFEFYSKSDIQVILKKRTTKAIGDLGENLAVTFLKEKGYTILSRNYRYSRAEVDIIARLQGILIFIEVKTRSYTYYGEPSESVTPAKERMLFDAANVYMEQQNHDGEIRFDIISIVLDSDDKPTIKHYEDAFFPGF